MTIHPTQTPLLSGENLAGSRGNRVLFRALNFDLLGGQSLQIHGTNGSGKTTLLRIVCGLTLCTEGCVRWMGADITEDPTEYRGHIAYVGHLDGVKLELTVNENLDLARALFQQSSTRTNKEVLAELGIASSAEVPVRALSAGQRRRVALARVLLGTASLWVLDEPFTALDFEAQTVVRTLIERHNEAGGICLFTSHQSARLSTPCKRLEL